MGAAIWAFMNSPLGMTLIASVAGKVVHLFVKSDTRRATLLAYADTAFHLVELSGQLKGKEKFLKFVQSIVNSLKAAGQPELSAKEMQLLQQLAKDKALLAKP